jgi:sugar lactone lactonase YvrE
MTLVASALAAVAGGCGGSESDETTEATEATPTVASRISLPPNSQGWDAEPEPLAAGGGAAWTVASYESPGCDYPDPHSSSPCRSAVSLFRLDPQTGNVDGDPVELSDSAFDWRLEYADGSVWVTSVSDPVVIRVQPPGAGAPGETKVPVDDATEINYLAADEESLWVTTDFGLSRIDLSDNAVETVEVDGEAFTFDTFQQIAVGGGHLWIADRPHNEVLRVDPDTGETKAVSVGFFIGSIGWDGERLWAATALGDDQAKVAAIDGTTAEIKRTIPLAASAITELAASEEEGVWVGVVNDPTGDAPEGTSALIEIDPETAEVGDSIEMLDESTDTQVAVGEGAVWVTLERTDEIARIEP